MNNMCIQNIEYLNCFVFISFFIDEFDISYSIMMLIFQPIMLINKKCKHYRKKIQATEKSMLKS